MRVQVGLDGAEGEDGYQDGAGGSRAYLRSSTFAQRGSRVRSRDAQMNLREEYASRLMLLRRRIAEVAENQAELESRRQQMISEAAQITKKLEAADGWERIELRPMVPDHEERLTQDYAGEALEHYSREDHEKPVLAAPASTGTSWGRGRARAAKGPSCPRGACRCKPVPGSGRLEEATRFDGV